MIKTFRLSSLFMCSSLLMYAACSGSDEPKPFDCADSDLAIVLATNGDIDPSTCSTTDGSIEVVATGGKGDYLFALGTGTFGTNPKFSGLGAGTFSITVKDQNACTKQLSVTLSVTGAPTVTFQSTQDTNCTAPGNGTLTVLASGGSGSYEYKLDNGTFGSSALFEFVASGGHTITVKDDEGCITTVNAGVPKGVTGINYVDDILPIFEAKCNFAGCHPDNGDWFTYSVAKDHASEIKSKTANGSMPKGGSSAPGGALSAAQIALIACWVNDGAPQN